MQLCLAELAILRADPDTTLNKRFELVVKCRHRNKYKLIPDKTPLCVDLFITSPAVVATFVLASFGNFFVQLPRSARLL